MIKLSEYAKLLCEKMTISQANAIFQSHGIDNASSLKPQELNTKYKELAKQYHPDKEGGDLRKMQDINDAYETLSDIVQTPSNPVVNNPINKKGPREPWQTDQFTSARNDNPQKPDINFYKKEAWELSGKPASVKDNEYTFWNWDGSAFRGILSVYTTPAHWYDVSKLLIEWDRTCRSKAVFVSNFKDQSKIYLVNLNGAAVNPPKEFTHNSRNQNPENDWDFIDKLRKEL